MIERHLVAQEEGLVGGHRFDHLDEELTCARHFELLNKFAQGRDPALARKGKQPAFDQVFLVGGKDEAGALLKQATQIIVV
jgi:hypothetical protein